MNDRNKKIVNGYYTSKKKFWMGILGLLDLFNRGIRNTIVSVDLGDTFFHLSYRERKCTGDRILLLYQMRIPCVPAEKRTSSKFLFHQEFK